MGKRILCTTNFSASSQEAVRWAVTLARQLEAHVTVLYAYRLIKVYDGQAVQMKRDIEGEALKNFATLEREVLSNQDIAYDFRMEIGFINDRVEHFTQTSPIDFLVVDKAMITENKESFDTLINRLKVPLVIVPGVEAEAESLRLRAGRGW